MADADGRPLIGVTGPRRGARGPRACVHVALRLAGAHPAHLRPGDALDLEELDGAVITGGHDVEPVLYRAAAEVAGRYDPERDAFESAVIDGVVARRKPLLGICRGAQLLNVRLGGTLAQDLRERRPSNRRTLLPLKRIRVEEGTRVFRCLRDAEPKVNCLHRQAIDELGTGLRVTSRDLHGIVQSVEHDEHAFLVGVQWHPEFLLYRRGQRDLFRELVRAAGGRNGRTAG